MDAKIEKLLNNRENNHMLPFLWVHGEPAETYRSMVKAIDEAHIRAFCVEARPHKAFCKEQWWSDLAVILDEAEQRGMQVWILDDKHFPTGYANGGVEKAPLELRRQNICRKQVKIRGGQQIRLNLGRLIHPKNNYDLMSMIMFLYFGNFRKSCRFKDDHLLSCTAYGKDNILDLGDFIQNGILKWQAPAGDWDLEICSLSRNTGMHRSYINMMDEASCRILIDEVYEPHFARFKDKFGTAIAGFFSDEPELGNGNFLKHGNLLGADQDLPYSRELASVLEERLGAGWKNLLPLLWNNDRDAQETARVRYIYMDSVTRLVEKDFSRQIGQWCKDHGVQYIGHVIEDNNQHARTSTSLGHFFRGLKWQTMAGIDDIGGQVFPNGEDAKTKNIFGYVNDGEFYHYALGKLGSSLGALNPNMSGNTMCEVFGNYGWSEGVRLEKYLLDHFMVRGVNHFVPHAFTSKDYPDKDCPPHFYAHGHDPQYRHFGQLMRYGNRVCDLISGGYFTTPVAILYHGEAEWTGQCMLMQKPARVLLDHQIDFNIVPCDVFAERDFYRTRISDVLSVNGRQHQLLLIPYAQFIPEETAEGIAELIQAGGKAVFLEALPDGICTGGEIPAEIRQCKVVKLADLHCELVASGLQEVRLHPENNRVRCMHYVSESEIFYLFNEGDTPFDGTVTVPAKGKAFVYDAWNNRAQKLEITTSDSGTEAKVTVEPSKSLIIVFNDLDQRLLSEPVQLQGTKKVLTNFRQSVVKSIDYPDFTNERDIAVLESYSKTDTSFSGLIRYQTTVDLDSCSNVILEITDAHEGVEVFVNGKSAGIQIVPRFIFDLSALCVTGQNILVIEVATTLERERLKRKAKSLSGITGQVNLYCS